MLEIWHGIGQRAGMAAILALIVLVILFTLQRRNKSAASRINFDDLLLDDGQMSKQATVMFGAFALTSWVMVYLTLSDKLTEGIFLSYVGGWVAPSVAKIFKPETDTSVTRTSTVSTQTVITAAPDGAGAAQNETAGGTIAKL